MKLIFSFILFSLLFISPFALSNNNAEFTFNVKVIAQMCKISVTGTSTNEVDFGNLTFSDIQANKVQPIPIKISLSDCLTKNFTNSSVKISPKNYLDTITFIDDPTKGFGISFSENDNVASSANISDFMEKESNVWTQIDANKLDKTLYTYVRCASGTPCDPQVGNFQSTITFSFIVD
ncbi:TPA: type 1 fimbrial protein [Providencia rettgeri]|uniref:fimbrial protein n=1 Tax=Providencia TaxID=586 RepID=UPI001B37BEB4|nr:MULTISPECIES: fimbrial protein [Providencia]EMB5787519.1 type 1 fimbrial protein [Providencia rettgeri]MBQ0365363.1 type 1 fimbrial protein [Providencia rettgeri]MDK7746047.1 fimbrial protein [Providencia rettgeri]MDK7758493.1 fimbrial protein [Providencia rettgeri]HBC7430255.1 type 1 fimbrial protein [Providencia rettgeri]